MKKTSYCHVLSKKLNKVKKLIFWVEFYPKSRNYNAFRKVLKNLQLLVQAQPFWPKQVQHLLCVVLELGFERARLNRMKALKEWKNFKSHFFRSVLNRGRQWDRNSNSGIDFSTRDWDRDWFLKTGIPFLLIKSHVFLDFEKTFENLIFFYHMKELV